MIYQQRFNPLSQLALLIAFCGIGILVSAILTAIIGNAVLHVKLEDLPAAILKPENVQVARLVQVLTSFLIFPVPALVVASLNGGNPVSKLGFNEAISFNQVSLVIFMVIGGFMVSGALGRLNEMLPIPSSAEAYFHRLEDEYNKEVMSIGNMKSFYDYIMSIIVLALLPGIFEEMLFRGCLQKIFVALARNTFWGILITSIIFSAVHFSYYGFLPRLFLGVLLGYIFHISKNIWLNITAHFLNNAYPVTVMYMLSRSGKLNADALEETYSLYYGLIGIVILIFVFILYKRESSKVLAHAGAQTDSL